MPTLRLSQSVDRSQLAPVAADATPRMAGIAPLLDAPSPFMTSPLPVMATGADQLRRQFYRANFPQQRILLPTL